MDRASLEALVAEGLTVRAMAGRLGVSYTTAAFALHFHHLDPAAKSFAIAAKGKARSLARARQEAARCVLLCANCHAEVEVGARQVPFRAA